MAVFWLLSSRSDFAQRRSPPADVQVLSDANFIKYLIEYDRDNVPERTLRALSRIVDNPAFTADAVGNQSKAAMSMCLWVRAMYAYGQITLAVAPKRARLEEAEFSLNTMSAQLRSSQARLAQSEEAAAAATAQLAQTREDFAAVQDSIAVAERRLARAGVLTSSLDAEADSWAALAASLEKRLQTVLGDAFVASACVAYAGPFPQPQRAALLAQWRAACAEGALPVADTFSLRRFMDIEAEVREWQVQVGSPVTHCMPFLCAVPACL